MADRTPADIHQRRADRRAVAMQKATGSHIALSCQLCARLCARPATTNNGLDPGRTLLFPSLCFEPPFVSPLRCVHTLPWRATWSAINVCNSTPC